MQRHLMSVVTRVFEAEEKQSQVWAREARSAVGDPLFYLAADWPQVEYEVIRRRCRNKELICPLIDCDDPTYHLVAGEMHLRRPHFRHLVEPGVGHAPESYYHIAGKAALGEWVRFRYPEARVQIDHERISTGQVPDVLVEFTDGRKYALEV